MINKKYDSNFERMLHQGQNVLFSVSENRTWTEGRHILGCGVLKEIFQPEEQFCSETNYPGKFPFIDLGSLSLIYSSRY